MGSFNSAIGAINALSEKQIKTAVSTFKRLEDQNLHTASYKAIAKVMDRQDMVKELENINKIHNKEGHLSGENMDNRIKIANKIENTFWKKVDYKTGKRK